MFTFKLHTDDGDNGTTAPPPAAPERAAPALPPAKWGAESGVYVQRSPNILFTKLLPGVYAATNHPCTGEIAAKPYVISTEKLIRVPQGTTVRLLSSIKTFWGARNSYTKLGMLHRRGILLYGAQGIGKTALISEVCEELVGDDGIVLAATDENLYRFVNVARMIRTIEPYRPLLLLLEDIERYVGGYKEEKLLSLLSGQDQINNTFVLATTNHLEKLPARLINRPSRFDEVVELQPFNLEQRRFFLRAFSQSDDSELIAKLAAASEGYAVAHLKEMIVAVFCLGEDSDVTIARLNDMIAREQKQKKREEGDNDESSNSASPTPSTPPKLAQTAWISGEVQVQSNTPDPEGDNDDDDL